MLTRKGMSISDMTLETLSKITNIARIRATKRLGRVLRNIMAIPIKRRTKRQHPFDN